MLVNKLHQLLCEENPKQENIVLTGCEKGDGIWDVLGYYDPGSCLIKICEPEIEKYAKELVLKRKRNIIYTRFVLRELVRLHEYAHSLLHTSTFGYLEKEFKMGYNNFPPTINEPLTVFISWSIVHDFGAQNFTSIFHEVDKDTPSYYQNWKKISKLISVRRARNDKEDRIAYYNYIPGLVHHARNGTWNDFSDYFNYIKENCTLAEAMAKLI